MGKILLYYRPWGQYFYYSGHNTSIIDRAFIIERGPNTSILNRGDNSSNIDHGDNTSIIDPGANTSIL